jgi:hypothetical protein
VSDPRTPCLGRFREANTEATSGGIATVDDLGRWRAVDDGDEHVRGLDVPVNDALLEGVLDRPADEHE